MSNPEFYFGPSILGGIVFYQRIKGEDNQEAVVGYVWNKSKSGGETESNYLKQIAEEMKKKDSSINIEGSGVVTDEASQESIDKIESELGKAGFKKDKIVKYSK